MEQDKKKKITLPRLLLIVAAAIALLFSAGITLEQAGIFRIGLPSWRQVFSFFGVRENGAREEAVTVELFDVGAADCILLSAGETHVLIDAGNPIDGPELAQTLLRRGIASLDLAVATHPHSDHIGGMEEILARVPAKCVWMPEPGEEIAPTGTVYADLLALLQEKEIPVVQPEQGTVWEQDGVKITVLHCGGETDNLNNLSIVLLLEYGDVSFLFTGDSEAQVEEALLASGALRPVTVLKVGHHGSKTSTSEAFLDAVTPQFAAISCGSDAPPGDAVLERLKERSILYHRTDLDGDLIYTTDGKQLWIYTEKGRDIA